MRRKQVRVVGNCQASAVANFYRNFVGAPAYEDVAYIDDLGKTTEDLQRAVQDADVLIVQERDFKHGLSKAELGGNVEVFTFPQILAGFLWPYANEPHVLNQAERPISDGPYPSQMGDSFLNRLFSKGVSPEHALDQYLALDVAKAAHLDRMFELYLDRQRERDRATGIDVASALETSFRTRKLFLTAEHPDAWLFGVMAAQLFEKMDVPSKTITAAIRTLSRSPFPPTELPLHPGVITHFRLTFADTNTTYTYVDEGRFTFPEYVLRYMRYDNNALLRKTMFVAGREDPSITLENLNLALEDSPRSIRGLRMKAQMLDRLDRSDEAIATYEIAISRDPTDPDGYVELVRPLVRKGACEKAEAVALRAVEIAPNYGRAHVALSEAKFALGDLEGGVEAAKEAIRLLPGEGQTCRFLAIALAGVGRVQDAESFARRGMLMEPSVPDHRNLVSEILEQQGRRADAISLLNEGRQLGCQNDQTFSLLGNLFLRSGALDQAEEAFSAGATLHGHYRTDLHDCLAQVRQLKRASLQR